jgi:hypothetical protein
LFILAALPEFFTASPPFRFLFVFRQISQNYYVTILSAFAIVGSFYELPLFRRFAPIIIKGNLRLPRLKGRCRMRKKYIAEITALVNSLKEEQLLYVLTFLKKLFGSH